MSEAPGIDRGSGKALRCEFVYEGAGRCGTDLGWDYGDEWIEGWVELHRIREGILGLWCCSGHKDYLCRIKGKMERVGKNGRRKILSGEEYATWNRNLDEARVFRPG